MPAAQMWCPACKDWTALVDTGRCPWCDGELEHRQRRGGWKRPDLAGGKLTEVHLRALYRAHVEQDMSINALAKQIYARVGYSSPGSAATSITRGWKHLGLKARDRIEMTRLASTTHGRGGRDRDEHAYRAWRAEQLGWRSLQGPGRPDCKAVKVNPPGAGQPCRHRAMEGSDYCHAHDPHRQLAHQAHLARVRARQPKPVMLPMGPFTAWLQTLAAGHGSIRAAAIAHGLPLAAMYSYVHGRGTTGAPKTEIAANTVERWAAAAGTSLAAIYQTGELREAA